MGRRRRKDLDLPPGVTRRKGRLYYGRDQQALGPEGHEAWEKYARLRGDDYRGDTFADAVRAFLTTELRKRAVKTQREYARQLKLLVKVFGAVKLAAIRPAHVRRYLNGRPPIAGTREKAALSLVFNFAREADLTTAPNPCAGVRGTKSVRTIAVTDEQFSAVLAHADDSTRTFLELAYRTGADASQVLSWTRADVRDGALHVRRSKTGRRVAVEVVGPLRAILDGLAARAVASVYLVADERGQPFTLQTMRRRFWKARTTAGQAWQIRDLRAKAGTDVGDLHAAQMLLGHAQESTTALYRRQRVGERAQPVMRRIEDGKAQD